MQLSSINPYSPPPFKKLKSGKKCTDKTKNTADLLSDELYVVFNNLGSLSYQPSMSTYRYNLFNK